MIANPNHLDIRHGGNLQHAIDLHGGSVEEWLDLSTGISPWGYPVSPIDDSVWRQLPTSNMSFLATAAEYYQCDNEQICLSPGSQLAIRLIPQLVKQKQSVAIPLIGYQEHASSWQLAGHSLIKYRNYHELVQLVDEQKVSSAVAINPNNPTGEVIKPESLMRLSRALCGVLIVDEAFADLNPQISICSEPSALKSNIVTLKSIGKFFGLAGARIGFVIGGHSIVAELNRLLSPWSTSGPSINLASQALGDNKWQAMQRQRITKHAKKQRRILNALSLDIPNSTYSDCGLFFSIFAENDAVTHLHMHLAQNRIWTRLGDSYSDQNQRPTNWLRFSLAGDHFGRLVTALTSINTDNLL